ncbi:MAG: 50S ribosomal protein L16 [Candidatus Saelkia tenebricola]|nr:50S ribosomal protein L16 [Candidatus Saelkia tenebricola]
MVLMPKRVKYRKTQRGKRRGVSKGATEIAFGEFGLQALGNVWVTNNQIEASRVAIMRRLRRGGKLWIRIFPDKPVTKKPLETRMGKGKGSVERWAAVVKRGRVLFELEGVSEEMARQAFKLASDKLSVPCKFIKRETL